MNMKKKMKNSLKFLSLAKLHAGSPIEAIERPNEFFNLPASLIPAKETYYL